MLNTLMYEFIINGQAFESSTLPLSYPAILWGYGLSDSI